MKVGLASKGADDKLAIVHTKSLVDALSKNDVQSAPAASGNGTKDNPYAKLNLTNWRWLASQKATADPICYSVGNRLLVRWGTNMGTLKDYVSDMTSHVDLLQNSITGPGDTGQKVKAVLNAFEDKSKGNLAPYSRKALRVEELTDEAAAQRSRSLLTDSDTSCDDCPEIASTSCALFIAEAHRAPITFLVSLMLLDLIESHTTYGVDGGKWYSWKSMLMHSRNDEAIVVPGREPGKVVKLAKHPMAGQQTVSLAKQMTNWSMDNAVRDRVVSIMSIWIGHYLQKTHPDRKYYLLRTGIKTNLKEQVKNVIKADKTQSEELLNQCKAAVGLRCGTAAQMIGGTGLEYMDFQGDLT